jgi:acetylornithine deacetylase/succinyl-diaminopimelate desuccinylase-like protein
MRRQVSEASQAVDRFLGDHRDELTQLVSDLVRIDSQIPPYADERQIVGFIRKRMNELDLGEGEIVAKAPERPNLISRIAGSGGGPTLMLTGHVDTKPVGDARAQWHSDPMVAEVRGGLIYGLGTSDMKGAVAAMVFAAAALRATRTELAGDLVLAFTADEEAGSGCGAKFLAPRLDGVDACLVGEPSGWERDWQGLHLVSRGLCCFRIRVGGTQMHSSLSDRMPSVNASRRMAELLLGIEEELQLDFAPHPLGNVTPTLNPGVLVSGGVYFGVVPGMAEFGCDLRTLPGMTEVGVHAAVAEWLERRRQAVPGLDVEVEYEPGLEWIPASEIAPEHPLVRATQSAALDVLSSAPPLSVFPGATDAPWYDHAGIPSIPSWGPGILTCCHGPNEFVALDQVLRAARMYARIAIGFCGIAVTESSSALAGCPVSHLSQPSSRN